MNPETLTIPGWLLPSLLTIIGSGFIVWGGLSYLKAQVKGLQDETKRNKDDVASIWETIERVRTEKVSRDEFKQMTDWMQRIDSKLDTLMGIKK